MFGIISSQEYIQFPYFLGLEIPMPLVHSPFLYLYVTAFTTHPARITHKLLHFIPFALALLSILPFLLLSFDDKILVYRNGGESYQILTFTIFTVTLLSGVVYCFLSLRFLYMHKKSIRDNFSYTEKINLQWLFNLVIGLLCIWVIAFFTPDKYIFSFVVLYVLFIGYFGIKQVGIFTNPLPATDPSGFELEEPFDEIEVSAENSKYEKSFLTDDQLESIHSKLEQLISQEKLHLVPGLNLSMVAKQLNVHPNILSQVINRVEQKNFFDYINNLRVKEFKEKVAKAENQKYTLLSLAYECGFNSKTSFNRNFKNITGQSPSEYLKNLQIKLIE
ncbi:helix-turn-helix domain-containing protein [Rapidithrix thailandica]